MTLENPLSQIHPRKIGPEGVTLRGAVPASCFDLPVTDRLSSKDDLVYNLFLSMVSHGLLVQGDVSIVLRCRCDRCLTYYDYALNIKELCYYYKEIKEDVIDLTEDIREDILLNFPQQLLCNPDCRGLCPRCGQNLNVRSCGCEAGNGGGVWDVLDKL